MFKFTLLRLVPTLIFAKEVFSASRFMKLRDANQRMLIERPKCGNTAPIETSFHIAAAAKLVCSLKCDKTSTKRVTVSINNNS